MKFWRVAGILSLCLIIAGGFVILLAQRDSARVGEFSLQEYQWYIEMFPMEKSVGAVEDVDAAKDFAIALWKESYGEDELNDHGITNKRKLVVEYDPNSECWHIRNKVPRNQVGGVFHALVQRDGKVVTVWIDD